MSEIIIFIKRKKDWQSIKKSDTFEIFNSWNTLYLFLYILYFIVLHTLNFLSSMFSVINNDNFSFFGFSNLSFFKFVFRALKKKIFVFKYF